MPTADSSAEAMDAVPVPASHLTWRAGCPTPQAVSWPSDEHHSMGWLGAPLLMQPSHKCSATQVAPQVEADPARVLMPTAASSAEAMDAGGSAFEAVHGFTTADVLKDKRFRVRHRCASERL